jgi:hypothetical protein
MTISYSRQQYLDKIAKTKKAVFRSKRSQPEHDEQVGVFNKLRSCEQDHPDLAFVFAVPNGGARHPAVAGRLKAEGVKRGVPDICIPIPRKGFHGLFIEMKVGKNTITPDQKAYRDFLIRQGYDHAVCYGQEEALTRMGTYLDIDLSRP